MFGFKYIWIKLLGLNKLILQVGLSKRHTDDLLSKSLESDNITYIGNENEHLVLMYLQTKLHVVLS